MKAFEVIDKDGKSKALFYCDYFRRPTKRGGAWMDGFQKQSRQRNQMPIIFNVCNNAKAPEGKPSLLTWDEVTTLFHEFGHALHGILSDCQYNRLSGTSVARDFVEMPSQFNESFASIPEIFDHYALHCDTGEPMPADLKERMLKSISFQTAYALGENLAATCLDLAWHMLPSKDIPTADKAAEFETEALRQIGLLNPQIPPRYSTSYFNHVWGGGYAAGYYSYLWTEVLAVNIADVFAKRGALTAFAGVDPGKNESGQHIPKSAPTSKKGSPHLRRTLFQIMESLIQRSPEDDAVYAFMDKKRAQGKPYYVYMTAGSNKFLRIYYGRVNEYLASLSESN
jgi:peptidyl-dipeptidase Dcp